MSKRVDGVLLSVAIAGLFSLVASVIGFVEGAYVLSLLQRDAPREETEAILRSMAETSNIYATIGALGWLIGSFPVSGAAFVCWLARRRRT